MFAQNGNFGLGECEIGNRKLCSSMMSVCAMKRTQINESLIPTKLSAGRSVKWFFRIEPIERGKRNKKKKKQKRRSGRYISYPIHIVKDVKDIISAH